MLGKFCEESRARRNHLITKTLNCRIPMVPARNFASRSERGYILITLILFVSLLAIAAMVLVPIIAFQVKRDREQELIHRGVQYSRAMKYYVKKFGRYPTRLEELENTNQVRFLRRRYKDPITGKDFKILRMGDVQMAFGAGLAGATPVTAMNQAALAPGAQGAPGGPGIGGKVGLGTLGGAGNMVSPGGSPPGFPSPPGSTPPGTTPPGTGGTVTQNSEEGGDTEAPNSSPNGATSFPAAGPGAPGAFGTIGGQGSGQGAQVFGGGPMVGVASTSKDKSIRIFNKKDHYNQWQFIYDPSSDRGGLLTTPNQPSLQGASSLQPGIPGAPPPPGGINVPPGPVQPGQPNQPGMQTPQMPPDQDQ
jgi:type II secretory pathway pseudopilin PulG